MDLYKAIRLLYEERERLDRVIALLEQLRNAAPAGAEAAPAPPAKRRGRKTMTPEERREVSERMKRYWAKRKKKRKDTPPEGA
jgi:hypothetical protein